MLDTRITRNAKHVIQNIYRIVGTNGALLVTPKTLFTTSTNRWVLQDRDGQKWKREDIPIPACKIKVRKHLGHRGRKLTETRNTAECESTDGTKARELQQRKAVGSSAASTPNYHRQLIHTSDHLSRCPPASPLALPLPGPLPGLSLCGPAGPSSPPPWRERRRLSSAALRLFFAIAFLSACFRETVCKRPGAPKHTEVRGGGSAATNIINLYMPHRARPAGHCSALICSASLCSALFCF